MNQLWDIGRTRPRDKYSRDEVKEEIQEYKPRFKENHEQDIPTHPYKVYREIVENRELNDLERAGLHYLKEEYSKKWKQKKQRKVKATGE